MKVALVHDYLTQRGGAERVVLSMLKAFPDAPLYTSLYNPRTTFPEFRSADIRTLPLNRIPTFRRNHRMALPLLAPAFSSLRLTADVVICSSSGWSHGVRTTGRKIVYCYTPARWLYQTDRYLGPDHPLARSAFSLIRGPLEHWDRQAAATADLYLAISTVVKQRIQTTYGIQAELLPPPQAVETDGPQEQPAQIVPGFFLCVSRLLPYKNVGVVTEAFRSLSSERLVVAGDGPEYEQLRTSAPPNVRLVGTVSDSHLRWLYSHCCGLVAPSYEDLGLTTLEAAAFGKPSAALRWGGYLDTVREGETGIFFSRPEAALVAEAVQRLSSSSFDPAKIRRQAAEFGEAEFLSRLRETAFRGSGPQSGTTTDPEPRLSASMEDAGPVVRD